MSAVIKALRQCVCFSAGVQLKPTMALDLPCHNSAPIQQCEVSQEGEAVGSSIEHGGRVSKDEMFSGLWVV